MPRPRPWTDDQLRAAVAQSTTMREVTRRLGIGVGGETYARLRVHIARLDIDASHLPVLINGRVRPRRSWTDDELTDVVRNSTSMAGVLRGLGYAPSGGMHRYMNMQIARLGLTTAHFTGQAWAAGVRRPGTGFSPRPLQEILVAGSTYTNSGGLRRRLIAAGLKQARCEMCGLAEWRGSPLPLHLDHINGDPTDNRFNNLRILCPNCHAQTDTWCARNRGRTAARGKGTE